MNLMKAIQDGKKLFNTDEFDDMANDAIHGMLSATYLVAFMRGLKAGGAISIEDLCDWENKHFPNGYGE